jgi:FtsH-binding integral membrane protein
MLVMTNMQADERHRRVRRNVWWLVALALTVYVVFIYLAVSGARG